MADLLRGNDCEGCRYYDSEANDFFFEWCTHPNVEGTDRNGNYIYLTESTDIFGDIEFFVSKCPITGETPHDEER